MPKATAVIMTALDNEYQEVMRHVNYVGRITHPAGTIYDVGTFDSPTSTWAVVVARNGKRNVRTAILTERAIRFFEPDVLIFAGCAGGRKECKFGDVVAVARVSDAEAGADTEGGFEGADQGSAIPYELEEKLNYLGVGWKSRAQIQPNFYEIRDQGQLVVETIASVEKTQKAEGSRAVRHIARSSRDAVAVDTESHGFLTAARMSDHKCAFVVRGISDLLVDKNATQDQVQQPVATAFAAAVAYEFIAQRNPQIQLTHSLGNGVPGTVEIMQLMSRKFEVPSVPRKRRGDSSGDLKLDFGPFADAGFFAEVIAEKEAGRGPEEVDVKVLCEIATLCQKAGYLETSWRFLFEALGRAGQPPLSTAVKAHAYWLALRLLSQRGDSNGVINNFKNVIAWLERNNEPGKIAPIYSRVGVAYAALERPQESKRYFQMAANQAKMFNEHQRTTVNVLWALASHFRDVGFENNPLRTVIDAQHLYLTSTVDAHLAQAYPLKSTLQCLFAEAAMLLSSETPDQGLLRLAAASMVRRRAFSHPEAEGFAELLTLIRSTSASKLVRDIMDPTKDTITAAGIRPFLTKCSSLTSLFSFGHKEWHKLRLFLNSEGQKPVTGRV